MNHIKTMQKRYEVDIGYHQHNLETLNGVGRVGKYGIDKNFTLEQVIQLAYEIDANIIVKAGKNAKWYLKRFHPCEIEEGILNCPQGDTSRRTMWIIEWDRV